MKNMPPDTALLLVYAYQWKQEKIHFDAIYTGYLGSFEQLDLMHKLIADFGGGDTLTIVDPCMADNGKLYTGFTQEFAFAMAKLCGKANVIVPNLTEASYLLGIPYKPSGYDEDYIKDILKKLAALGAQKIVLKGVEFAEDQADLKGVAGKGRAGRVPAFRPRLRFASRRSHRRCAFHR